MFRLFRKNQKNVDKKPVSEEPVNNRYTDPEIVHALQKDGIAITEEEIQKARANDSDTFYKIGDAYYKKKKYDKAFAWFYKAALQEHAESQARVGEMYSWGWSVSKNYKQAMDWSMKAASTGNATGQFNIGELYYHGWGVSEDDKQAMGWYLKAANNGNAEAMNKIGFMYRNGVGVAKNIPTAIEWYTKAANQGDMFAQNSLGEIYEYEDEVKDLQKSINWYQKADDNGHDDAKQYVKQLNEQGYHAKVEEQEEVVENKTIHHDNSADAIISDQNQPSTLSSNDEHLSKVLDDKIEAIEKAFQSKMSLMETNYETNTDALQKELAALKREKLLQHQENRLLKERLARMEAGIQDDSYNDLNYDSSDNEDDSNNDINYDSEFSEEDATANTQQTRNHRHLLDTSADPNYDSSGNKNPKNDIYLD